MTREMDMYNLICKLTEENKELRKRLNIPEEIDLALYDKIQICNRYLKEHLPNIEVLIEGEDVYVLGNISETKKKVTEAVLKDIQDMNLEDEKALLYVLGRITSCLIRKEEGESE